MEWEGFLNYKILLLIKSYKSKNTNSLCFSSFKKFSVDFFRGFLKILTFKMIFEKLIYFTKKFFENYNFYNNILKITNFQNATPNSSCSPATIAKFQKSPCRSWEIHNHPKQSSAVVSLRVGAWVRKAGADS